VRTIVFGGSGLRRIEVEGAYGRFVMDPPVGIVPGELGVIAGSPPISFATIFSRMRDLTHITSIYREHYRRDLRAMLCYEGWVTLLEFQLYTEDIT
jgi:hypothetical protein